MSEENLVFTVGDRQYDVEAAKTKIENQDQHISKIQEENEELRGKMETYMEALAKTTKEEGTTETNTPVETRTDIQGGLSAEDIARIVEEKLAATRTQNQLQQNAQTIESALIERFGDADTAKNALAEKAKELGLSSQTVDTMVAESPKAVLGLFGAEAPPPPASSAAAPGRNTIATAGAGPTEGSWAWWQEMRKSDPAAYNKPAAAMQRMRDAERLGKDKFFN